MRTPRSFAYQRHPDQDRLAPAHHRVVVVGAGPTGLALAIDLKLHGVDCVVVDDNDTVSVGSRAICFAQRTLEIFDRYGCAQAMLEKGVQWRKGKVFFRDELIYEFDLQPDSGYRMPAFINLQQYFVEEILIDRAVALGVSPIRWRNRVVALDASTPPTRVTLETPQGRYALSCDYLLVADGANSDVRRMMELTAAGQVFNDRFLITDIRMTTDLPTERRFHFDPSFHPNQSVLLHRQADDVWRIDFQLGAQADAEAELKLEMIEPRVRAMLGDVARWSLEWASVYTFRCQKLDRFIHGGIIFLGDAAHQVSPFGARGANGAVQGAENLAWKLARVLRGDAPDALLASYDLERQRAARENILNSTRATDFITPKSAISRVFRDAALTLARDHPFARSLVNSGRLSVPCCYIDSPLNTPILEPARDGVVPGAVAPDAPIDVAGHRTWLQTLLGGRFVLLMGGAAPTGLESDEDLVVVCIDGPRRSADQIEAVDVDGLVRQRYALHSGSGYLIRPDQHVCARWRHVEAAAVRAARGRALGTAMPEAA